MASMCFDRYKTPKSSTNKDWSAPFLIQLVMLLIFTINSSLAAKSKNVTFDGKICYKLPSMLNHIFIRWAIWYGWMAGFLLSFKVFLGQKMN